MPSASQKPELPVTAFIPSWLDDSDLTPNEFRIFSTISRRGNCFESVTNMARRIKMHPDTVWDVLNSLEARGCIARTKRPGQTTLFTARHIDLWKSPTGKGGVTEIKGCPSKPGDTRPLDSVDTHPKIRGTPPPEAEGCKVNPIEGNPSMSIPAKEPRTEILKFSEVYEEASRIGLPQWRAAEWLNEIGNKPIDAWRERLQLVFLKWDLEGRPQKPKQTNEVNQNPTTAKPRSRKRKANA
jgi:hypothetical protein